MGRLWIHINTKPLGHLHPGNPSDPRATAAVRSWNFKLTIPLLSRLFLSLFSCVFLSPSLDRTVAGSSWICPNRKSLNNSAQGPGAVRWSQLVIFGRNERGHKSRGGQICDDNQEGSLSFAQPSCNLLSENKNKQKNKAGKIKLISTQIQSQLSGHMAVCCVACGVCTLGKSLSY